ncbi:MAG: hypothetical protein HOW73_47460 [Polyangiaceae bacterium]|nr:hypothetical protein [Polyangiaceae bacterium]
MLLLASFSTRAGAEPSAEERAQAEALFNEARELIDKGELAPACERFAQSQKLDPQIGTLLYLATCHEQVGQTATAWVEFKEALSLAEAANKPDRVQQARDGATRVEASLAKATVVVTDKALETKVRINGREVTVFDTALPYNPGTLSVEAEAPGRMKHAQSVELPAGPSSITITIPVLEPEKKIETPPKPPPDKDHTLAYIVGGTGIGVTIIGLGLGGAAWATKDAADKDCNGSLCSQDGLDGHDTANGLAWGSNILVGAGLLGVGAGVVLFFVWPPDEEKPATTTGMPYVDVAPGVFNVGYRGVLP